MKTATTESPVAVSSRGVFGDSDDLPSRIHRMTCQIDDIACAQNANKILRGCGDCGRTTFISDGSA